MRKLGREKLNHFFKVTQPVSNGFRINQVSQQKKKDKHHNCKELNGN